MKWSTAQCWGGIVLILVLFSACTWRQAEQTLWPDVSHSHAATTAEWTRMGQIYSGLQTRIRIRATYKSEPWRDSFVRRWEAEYGLSPQESAAMQDAQSQEYRQGATFVVALSSSDSKLAQLDWSDGLWRLQLVHSGNRIDPVDLRPLEWPHPKLETFFPYAKPWLQFYEVRFPVVVEEGPFQLLLGGPGGPIRLQWDTASPS